MPKLPTLRASGRTDTLFQLANQHATVEAMLVLSLDNIRWLTGFTGSAGILVVGPQEMVFVTDGRYVEQAIAQAKLSSVEVDVIEARSSTDQVEALTKILVGRSSCSFDPAELSVENYEIYQQALTIKLVAQTGLVKQLRRIKTEAEIARIEAACLAADKALADVESMLTDGVTERNVRDELEYLMRRHGADGPSYETIVATGLNGVKPHHRPTIEQIANGHSVVIDVGALVDGYHSDMTRTYLIGNVNSELAEIHQIVCEAQLLGLAKVAPGVLCSDVDFVCRQFITEHGYGEEFVHGTGHGVGLQIHELPWIRKDFHEKLQVGEVVTVEPGVYRGGLGGVRIEDLVLVTPTGNRVLTLSQKDNLCPPSRRMT